MLPRTRVAFVVAVIALLIGARSIASLIIEYQWWKEMGQLATWQSIIAYNVVPQAIATVVAFFVLWIAHARGLKAAGTGLREQPFYAKASTLGLLLLALLLSRVNLSGWTFVSYAGAQQANQPSTWRDPIFGRGLSFYLFDLPFFSELVGYLLTLTFFAALVYLVASVAWSLFRRFPNFSQGQTPINFEDLNLLNRINTPVFRSLAALFLLLMAVRAYLSRFASLDDEHNFLVGVDYVANNITLPLQWIAIGGFILAAVFAMAGRLKLVLAVIGLIAIRNVVPPIVSAAYVKPNELTLQRPYIEHHISATRSAYGLDSRLEEKQFPAQLESKIDPALHQPLLDNVRLWDWRAFHDTVTQIQALRQYYVFFDTDVDRYTIDGKLRQVMLAPRELDIRQLPDARANWINAHFIYTHGYGLVMAEANRITPSGQPVLFIHDAPPKIESSSLKLTRPEIYFGEVMHEPVIVRTEQPEFDYPAGSENRQTRYEGTGGIPITGFGMRLAAALAYADRNLLLTSYLTPESRMLIHRKVQDRVEKLASFVSWDSDPYLVITEEGRMVWMIDGYTSSWRHPYSRRIRMGNMGTVNYVRNSVKATIDAYDGTVAMYVFDESDPIINSYRSIFPDLFRPASSMPSGLRAHTRYPESFFLAQAEIYRTFHMQDPESFYNKEDLWDIAKNISTQANQSEPSQPTFVVATLPGETKPEYLLVLPFTPRSKDNLIGLMLARCDGDNLGQLKVLQLSKQSLIYGPLQIEARIDSDQNIAKDLSLWNQQGSQVLRGQMLVLPIGETFLYVEPIYIQSSQAKMPQLKKVVLAMGNTLIYEDTYEQALVKLGAGITATAPVASTPASTTTAAVPASTAAAPNQMESIRGHMRRYRELSSQGKWAEAGRELEALEKLVITR